MSVPFSILSRPESDNLTPEEKLERLAEALANYEMDKNRGRGVRGAQADLEREFMAVVAMLEGVGE